MLKVELKNLLFFMGCLDGSNKTPVKSKFLDFDSDKDSEINLERRNIAMMKALRKQDTKKLDFIHIQIQNLFNYIF